MALAWLRAVKWYASGERRPIKVSNGRSSWMALAAVMVTCADSDGGGCFPSLKHLQRHTGMNRGQIVDLRKRWVDLGWLIDTGRKACNAVVYQLAIPSEAVPERDGSPSEAVPERDGSPSEAVPERDGSPETRSTTRTGAIPEPVPRPVPERYPTSQPPHYLPTSPLPPDLQAPQASARLSRTEGGEATPPASPPVLELVETDPAPAIARQAIALLNELTGSAYSPTAKKTLGPIRARLKEKGADGKPYRWADFEVVIRDRVNRWGEDPKMSEYLRPETLFGTKFAGYRGKAGAHERKRVPPSQRDIVDWGGPR